MTIAATILAQLGNGRFICMTGAKDMIDTGKGLRMTLPATMTKGRVNRLSITLDANDTYTVETAKFAKLDYRAIDRLQGVYCDMLHETIRDMTGLATRL